MELPAHFGPYVLVKALGGGGMGDVFLARPAPGRGIPAPVVIKRLRSQLNEERFIRRFSHEAQIATCVESEHVAKVFDAGCVGGELYIAMEYIAGWSLQRVIEQLSASRQRPSIQGVVDVMWGVLSGLEALHTARDGGGRALSIIHRDIAPKNIMIGDDRVVRLIDLGIGRSELRDWRTATGQVLGSPGYMAPEQVAGGTIDHRIDIYAAGAVMFELLTLEPYIPRSSSVVGMLRASLAPRLRRASELRPEIPEWIDRAIEKALAPAPERRFSSASEFLRELRSASDQRPDDERMRSLIGEMLLSEIEQERTEVSDRLRDTIIDPDPSSREGTIVFAQRAGVSLSERSVLDPTFVPVPVPALRRPGRSRWWLAPAAVLLVAAGAVIESLRHQEPEVIEIDHAAAASPAAVARPHAVEAVEQGGAVEPVEAVEAVEGKPVEGTAARRAPSAHHRAREASAPREASPQRADAPAASPATARQEAPTASSLTARARALDKRSDLTEAQRKKLKDVFLAITDLGVHPDRAKQIERDLAELERSP